MAGGKGRRSFTREFKARVARDAMRDVEPVNAVAARHGVGPGLVRDWRRRQPIRTPSSRTCTPKSGN